MKLFVLAFIAIVISFAGGAVVAVVVNPVNTVKAVEVRTASPRSTLPMMEKQIVQVPSLPAVKKSPGCGCKNCNCFPECDCDSVKVQKKSTGCGCVKCVCLPECDCGFKQLAVGPKTPAIALEYKYGVEKALAENKPLVTWVGTSSRPFVVGNAIISQAKWLKGHTEGEVVISAPDKGTIYWIKTLVNPTEEEVISAVPKKVMINCDKGMCEPSYFPPPKENTVSGNYSWSQNCPTCPQGR